MTMTQEGIMVDHPVGMARDVVRTEKAVSGDEKRMFGIFLLAGQEFAIAVSRVRETIPLTGAIVRVPASIDIVEGIIDLRGSIIPIINLKTRMHLQPREYTEDCKVAIVACRGRYFGLLFDDIREVLRPDEKSIHLMEHESNTTHVAVSGVINYGNGERLIQIIDPDRLLQHDDIPLLKREMIEATEAEERCRQRVETIQTILFRIQEQEYAIDVKNIREIIRVPDIERRLLVDEFIKGVLTLRNELITIVDLGMYMGLGESGVDGDSRIIILEGAMPCGILVDSIREVLTFAKTCVKPIPLLSTHGLQRAYQGLISLAGNGGNRNFILLDTEKLFSNRLWDRFEQNIILHRDQEAIHQQAEIRHDKEDHSRGEYDGKVLVSFSLGQPFAIDITLLREIIRYDESIIPLPGQSRSIEGVLHLRGTIIPIVNLRSYYNLEEPEERGNGKILIIHNQKRCAGIVVDDLIEILKIERGGYRHAHQILGNHDEKKIKNHIQKVINVTNRDGEDKTVIVFDVENFLNDLDIDIATEDQAAIRRYDVKDPVENFVV